MTHCQTSNKAHGHSGRATLRSLRRAALSQNATCALLAAAVVAVLAFQAGAIGAAPTAAVTIGAAIHFFITTSRDLARNGGEL